MISINFTGNTLREVADQAGLFAAQMFQAVLAVAPEHSLDPLPPFPKEIFENLAPKTVDPLPLDGHDLIPTAEAVEAAKRKRRTKAEMEAARAVGVVDIGGVKFDKAAAADVVSPIEAAAEATAATPAPAAEFKVTSIPELEHTVADVKAALMKVVEKDGLGPTAGSKLLAQFGVKRVSELDAKTFADFIAACNAAVAA